MAERTPPRTLNRVAAKLVDFFIVMSASAVLPRVVGPLLGFGYSMLADGFRGGPFYGQSVGKRLFGLQVVHQKTGEVASFRDSIIRNTPVGVATFFAIIPIWGWIILFFIGLPLMLIEIYLIARVARGHRLGDVMADTEVVLVDARALRIRKGGHRSGDPEPEIK